MDTIINDFRVSLHKRNNINEDSVSSLTCLGKGRSGGASYWWKIIAVILVLYTIIAGFLLNVPAQPILHETVRNLYFHVPMWFSMMAILFVSVWHSIKYLGNSTIESDIKASQAAHTGMLVGCIGAHNRFAMGKVHMVGLVGCRY